MMPARFQGRPPRRQGGGVGPDVEYFVRKWLTAGLDGFYCGLQLVYTPHVIGPVRVAVLLGRRGRHGRKEVHRTRPDIVCDGHASYARAAYAK